MEEQQYWYLAQGKEDEPEDSLRVLSIPWWPEAVKWEHREGTEQVDAPMLFTTREAAEAEVRGLSEPDPDGYLRLVSALGEKTVNEALDNSSPYRTFSLNSERLADKLEDSHFLCVMVDGRMKLRQDLLEELRL